MSTIIYTDKTQREEEKEKETQERQTILPRSSSMPNSVFIRKRQSMCMASRHQQNFPSNLEGRITSLQ